MSLTTLTDSRDFWTQFIGTIRPHLSAHVVQTWFEPITCLGHNDSLIKLAVRDQFTKDWLTDHYLSFLQEKLSSELKQEVSIQITIDPNITEPELPPDEPEEPRPQAAPAISPLQQKHPLPRFNKRYVFDAFVRGPSNEFAFAACKAVANNPGMSYNPLFIFGGVGLGKTHLLSSIGQDILRAETSRRVIYSSSEQFQNEVVNAVMNGKLGDFRDKYRTSCDVLLMDDIQLIAGKERTQHELFHAFNTLYDSQRQIVVTSDKLPHEIPEIEERLRNRFQWGLIADIQPPEIETRVAILHKKALTENIRLKDDIAFFLAKNVRSNVRELEGALVRLLAHSSLTKSKISIDYARRVLTDLFSQNTENISVESIQRTVAAFFHVRVADLKSKGRQKALVRPRQVAMFLCRKHAGASYPELGQRFGKKDHTTIMSACKRIESLLKKDPSLRSQILDLERQLDVINPVNESI